MNTPNPTPPPGFMDRGEREGKKGLFHDPIPASVFAPPPSGAAPQRAVVTERHLATAAAISRQQITGWHHMTSQGRESIAQLLADSEAEAVAEATVMLRKLCEEEGAGRERAIAQLTEALAASKEAQDHQLRLAAELLEARKDAGRKEIALSFCRGVFEVIRISREDFRMEGVEEALRRINEACAPTPTPEGAR